MSRPRKIPSYRHHKSSGQAVVTLSGRDVYLGRYDTPESRDRYHQVVTEWLANHRQTPASSTTGAMPDCKLITVNELFVAYWQFCHGYYVTDGQPTGECANVRDAMRHLVTNYGSMRVQDFRPATLKAVRQDLIDKGLCRRTVNDRINRIRRMFRWGVENDMVDASVLHALQAVAALRRGRGGAREGTGVKPVPDDRIEAVMSHLPPVVRAMVRLQQVTGMRPGELVIMRTCDIDTTGEIWSYRPSSHKTEHFGHERLIHIGRRGQDHLRPYLRTELDAFLFDPRQAMSERWAVRPTHRRQPNKKRKTSRKFSDRYTTASYLRAIYHACDQAYPPPTHLQRLRVPGKKGDRWEKPDEWRQRLGEKRWAELQQWRKEHRWHPHPLRHTAATFLRKQFGVEAARVVLGHRSAAVTEIYAELDQMKAADIMARVG